MPDKKKPSKAEEVASGFATLRKLTADSAKKSSKKADTDAKPVPPAVDTGSFSGLVKSLKDRASYAFFGPPKKGEKQ